MTGAFRSTPPTISFWAQTQEPGVGRPGSFRGCAESGPSSWGVLVTWGSLAHRGVTLISAPPLHASVDGVPFLTRTPVTVDQGRPDHLTLT